MAFDLGDEYTGPKKLKTGKVINMDDGTYVEGGVRYIWTGEGENFIPEGGWGAATPAQIASDVSMGDPDNNPVDAYGNSLYTQGTRADGSPIPGGWSTNPDFYIAPVKPADADTAADDANGNSKYTTTQDAKGNTVWNLNPDYNSGKKGGEGDDGGDSASTDAFKQWTISQQQATASATAADLQ